MTNATNTTTTEPSEMTTFGVSITEAFQNSSDAAPICRPVIRLTELDFWVLEIIWFFYCCMGKWSIDQPLRMLALAVGCLKAVIENIYRGSLWLTLSWFATYLLGRIHIDSTRLGLVKAGTVIIWLGIDVAAVFYNPLKLVSAIVEAMMAVAALAYLVVMTMAIKERGRGRWLHKIGAIALWGLGWGITVAIYWAGSESSIGIAAWLMMYEPLFPRKDGPTSPGLTPPPMVLASPWLHSLAARRSTKRSNTKRGP